MKTRLLFLFTVLLCLPCIVLAQSPQKFNYQAVVRDVSGNPITDSDIGIKLTILQGSASGTAVCIEEFSPTTNSYGLMTIEVGSSNEVDFNAIDWSDGPYFLKVEADQSGGTIYTELGTTQLLSVPYALHAATAGKSLGDSLWRQSGSKIYYNSGNVGIGISDPDHKLTVNSPPLGNNAGDIMPWALFMGRSGNWDKLFIYQNRHTDGSDWNSSEIRIQKQVDASPMHYLSFRGESSNNASLEIGYNQSPAITIDKYRRVGIGTTNPLAQLHTTGSVRFGTNLNLWNDTKSLHFRQDATQSWISNIADFVSNGSGTNGYLNLVGENGVVLRYGQGSGAGTAGLTLTNQGQVGVGTQNPDGRMSVVTNSSWPDEDPLFQVRNKDGTPVFAVFNNGVRVLIEDDPAKKGPKGGFAIGGFDRTKAGSTVEFMRISPDSIRFNINNSASKGPKGGFAIGGFDRTKGAINEDFMYITPQSSGDGQYNAFFGYHAGLNNSSTGHKNTFIGYEAGLSNSTGDYNAFMGTGAGRANTGGGYNVYIGNDAGKSNKSSFNVFVGKGAGSDAISTAWTTLIGFGAGTKVSSNYNTMLGSWAGPYTTTGEQNTFIGTFTGWSNQTGSYNVMIGQSAGETVNGSGNVLIGYKAAQNEGDINDKLYIDNSNTSDPLIKGDFSTDRLNINGEMRVYGNSTANYALVTNGGQHLTRSLYVYKGAYTTGSWQTSSDIRYKNNIRPIEDALDIIKSINGVRFSFNTVDFSDMGFSDKQQVGVIAQDIEKVLPELVTEDEDGYKAVAYDKLTSVLVEAVKGQQEQIENQHEEINVLNSRINMLEQMVMEMAAREE